MKKNFILDRCLENKNDWSKNSLKAAGLVLGIAAMVSTTTSEIVKKAMENVPTKMVLAWCKEHIGSSVQAKKIEMLEAVK